MGLLNIKYLKSRQNRDTHPQRNDTKKNSRRIIKLIKVVISEI